MLSIETWYTKSCDSFANIDLTNKISSFPFPILSSRLLSTSSSPYLGKIPSWWHGRDIPLMMKNMEKTVNCNNTYTKYEMMMMMMMMMMMTRRMCGGFMLWSLQNHLVLCNGSMSKNNWDSTTKIVQHAKHIKTHDFKVSNIIPSVPFCSHQVPYTAAKRIW